MNTALNTALDITLGGTTFPADRIEDCMPVFVVEYGTVWKLPVAHVVNRTRVCVNNTLRLPYHPVKTKAGWKVGIWDKRGNEPCLSDSDVWDEEAAARRAANALNVQRALTKMRAFFTPEDADAERKRQLKQQRFSWVAGNTCRAIQ